MIPRPVTLKENQLRMWDVREYELVVRGRPTRVPMVSVLEYSWTSHIRGSFSFYYMPKLFHN